MPLISYLLLFAYVVGVLLLLFWVINAEDSRWLKLAVSTFYLIGIPGFNLAQEAKHRAEIAKAEKKWVDEKSDAFAAHVKFCEDNIKGDSPLPECRPFKSLGPEDEQLSIK